MGKTLKATDTADESAVVARNILKPSLLGASTVKRYDQWVSQDINLGALVDELSAQCQAASDGDLTRAEAMLVSQAHSLDAMFNYLAGRASLQGVGLDISERLLRLAFKAQAQCRATVETLAAVKNPPVVLARQANITTGPQQVNNGVAPPRARVPENRQNKLLEATHDQRLDAGAPATTGCIDSTVATVGKVHGTQDARRKGARRS